MSELQKKASSEAIKYMLDASGFDYLSTEVHLPVL